MIGKISETELSVEQRLNEIMFGTSILGSYLGK